MLTILTQMKRDLQKWLFIKWISVEGSRVYFHNPNFSSVMRDKIAKIFNKARWRKRRVIREFVYVLSVLSVRTLVEMFVTLPSVGSYLLSSILF